MNNQKIELKSVWRYAGQEGANVNHTVILADAREVITWGDSFRRYDPTRKATRGEDCHSGDTWLGPRSDFLKQFVPVN